MIVMAKDAKPVKKRYPAGPCPKCNGANTVVSSSRGAESKYRQIFCGDCAKYFNERKP